jgi:Ca2+-binding RTX toxin-like protein
MLYTRVGFAPSAEAIGSLPVSADDAEPFLNGLDLVEPNDTLFESPDYTARLRDEGSIALSGYLGDNPNVDPAADEVDLVQFELGTGERVVFETFAWEMSDLDTILRVFDEAGNELAWDDDSGGGLNSLIDFTAPEAGVYAVGISSFANSFYDPFVEGSGQDGFSTGDYVLSVTLGASLLDLVEPNDTLLDAPDYTARLRDEDSLILIGYLGDNPNVDPAADEVDLVQFELGTGERVIFETFAWGLSDLDTILRVFDEAGNELAWDDDSGGGLNSLIDFTAPEAGVYAVGISSSANSFYDPLIEGSGQDGFSIGDYALSVRFGPTSRDLVEPNDTIFDAPDYTARLRDEGSLVLVGFLGDNPNVDPAADEVDLVLFELGTGERVVFQTIAWEMSGLDTILRVFDEAGNELAWDDDSGGGLNSLIDFTAPEAGVYAVGISSFANSFYDPLVEGSGQDGFSTGDYVLSVTLGTSLLDLVEPNDTLFEAPDYTARLRDEGSLALTGFLGDNPNVSPAADEVDLVLFELGAGERVVFETIAWEISGLDTILRVFDEAGNELAWDDDSGDGLNSLIDFTAPEAGVYAVGISSFANFDYDPLVEGSGENGSSTGEFILSVTLAPPDEPSIIFGTPTDDVLETYQGNRLVFAGDGNDLVDSSQSVGNNTVFGGRGDDTLLAGTDDFIFGEDGNDTLISTGSGNRLYGGPGNDMLVANWRDFVAGGEGDDIIFAGLGDNTLVGGPGRDQFWVATGGLPERPNTIMDFAPGEDIIGIAGLGLSYVDLGFAASASGTMISVRSDFDETPVVQVANVVSGELSASDFLFV